MRWQDADTYNTHSSEGSYGSRLIPVNQGWWENSEDAFFLSRPIAMTSHDLCFSAPSIGGSFDSFSTVSHKYVYIFVQISITIHHLLCMYLAFTSSWIFTLRSVRWTSLRPTRSNPNQSYLTRLRIVDCAIEKFAILKFTPVLSCSCDIHTQVYTLALFALSPLRSLICFLVHLVWSLLGLDIFPFSLVQAFSLP